MFPIRDENPTHGPTPVTILLIAVTSFVFLLQMAAGEAGGETLIYRYGLIPGVLTGAVSLAPEVAGLPPVLTLVTSMFLHGGFLHIAGNMLFLWIFGNNIEDSYGAPRFILLYFLSGLAAALAQVAQEPGATIPMIGASGAVSGVMGAYLRLFPRARVVTFVFLGFFFTIVRIRAFWFLGLWFGFQAFNALLTPLSPQGGVAFWAHVGGFVAGLTLSYVLPRRRWRRMGPWGS
ncbi:MAG: rhomboid family intramembrane serine protease [Pseudomonadota bacterium]